MRRMWAAIVGGSALACFVGVDPSHAQTASYDQPVSPTETQLSARPESQFDPRIFGSLRARYQGVDQDTLLPGDALTLRGQLGAEVDLASSLTVLIEGEGNIALNDSYDDGTQSNGRPFIPDPEGIELNRLQAVWEPAVRNRVTLGRQRIALDDWRFIGSFPFRQNDQTFDAVRFETDKLGPGLLDAGYIGQVHRPLGRDNPRGRFKGDSFYANYNLATPVGRLTAYHYRLDLQTRQDSSELHDFSNRISGARLFGRRDGEVLSLSWDAAFARQVDHADNPLDFAADYWLAEGTAQYKQTAATLRAETLGSDNGVGFQTPLASLHRFQGLADRFLTTPAEGVQDISFKLTHDFPDVGRFRAIRGFVRYHDFESASGDLNYGTEWDASLSARVGATRLSLEYANYNANAFSQDTQVLSVSAEWVFP